MMPEGRVNKKQSYYYQYGSEAVKYAPYPQPVYDEDKEKYKSPIRRPRTQTKFDILFGMKVGVCWTLIFATTFSFVGLYSSLTTKQASLKKMNSELQKIQSSISSVQSIISSTLNLEYIQEVASTELGMSEPLPHQVVYIQLPKSSYTVYTK